MINDATFLKEVKLLINKEKKTVKEIIKINDDLLGGKGRGLEKMAESQLKVLKIQLRRIINELKGVLEDMTTTKPLPKQDVDIKVDIPKIIEKKKTKKDEAIYGDEKKEKKRKHRIVDVELDLLERKTLKRVKKKNKKKIIIKEKKASKYVSFCNSVFGKISKKLSKTPFFVDLNRDIIKANLKYVISSYVSVILMTCLISFGIGMIAMIFFLFFNLGPNMPIITLVDEGILSRFLKIFWIPIAAPIVVFLGMHFYPAVEKAYIGNRIDQELPFATVHMAAISGSLVEPSEIFKILLSTKEYPTLEKEFRKLINLIHIYGYDFVSALRTVAKNTPSQKLTNLLNGLATTINSGGKLSDFFEKRSQSLLFDYRIEREKYTKSAETFMDIYISLVIAAPMILMLLLIMMRVSGLGINLSTSMITLVMILGVSMINILFLVFLQLKQPTS